jgi:hypothetical protein
MTTSVVTRKAWATVITTATDASVQQLKTSPDTGASQLPLISRTGFEQRHIVTSQIGSL